MSRRNWRRRPLVRARRAPTQQRGCLAPVLAICAVIMFGLVGLGLRPDLAAQGADMLRSIVGDAVVAWLEDTVFTAKDMAQHEAYQLGLIHASAPWASEASAPPLPPSPRATLATDSGSGSRAPTDVVTPEPAQVDPSGPARPTASPAWQPTPLTNVGSMDGVGQWSAYLTDAAGRVIAYRTFVQPDPDRPYVYTAVVAINLRAAQLHFMLGTEEPDSKAKIARPGVIPAADIEGGELLAAFNGGFKARHGHFGAMIDGVTVLPPRDGFGTIALYQDGRVRIGAWGKDILPSPGIVAWRQNGPLIIDHGAVNPHTADQTSQDWGIILKGVTAVERSGVGISADGSVLYYVAGDSLTLPRLVATFTLLPVDFALQLDINSIYVRFDVFQQTSSGLSTTPLLSAMKGESQRYLHPWSRDFFYLTATGAAGRSHQ